MKKLLHLAIVSPFPPTANGIGVYGYHISRALAEAGIFERITVLTETSPNAQSIQHLPQIRVERLWQSNSLNASWKIAARLQQLKPDVVWYNLGISTFGCSPLANALGLLSPALGRMAGFPSVVTLHEIIEQANLQALGAPKGWLATLGMRLIRFLTTRADVVCVTLHRHAQWLAMRKPNTRVMHIPHGVFNSPELLASSGDMELLMFGNLSPFKGLELLLDVFSDLHKRYPSLRLTVAGPDHPRYPNYASHVRHAFGEHSAVRWLGYVPESELRNIFTRATIVVLPYLATTGSSSVLYRAAGWGRPIVASNLPELHAVAEEERLWIEFFSCSSAESLTTTLERLLRDSALRAMQAQHNYHMIMRHLTLVDTYKAYLRAFNLALAVRNSNTRISVPLQDSSKVA